MPSAAISRIVSDAFRKAMSKGRFFNRHIEDCCPFQHMSGEPDNGRHAA
jgi:hypothetical protein